MPNRSKAAATLYVIDDDPMMRDGLDSLLRSFGFRVRCFASTHEFQRCHRDAGPACLILDVKMPGEDGLDFHKHMTASNDKLPVIFLTGHGDVPMAVEAMRDGAVEFLLKPFKADDLIRSIRLALAQNKRDLTTVMPSEERRRFERLTFRERRIVTGIVGGQLNKQIAADLGLKEITVKVSRAQIMRKLEVETAAALIAMVHRLEGVPSLTQQPSAEKTGSPEPP